MSRVSVCFGGPSPEHDISVLTGLQASHCLAELGEDPIALYWARNGNWHEVPATAEAGEFAEGLPGDAKPIELLAGEEGGFYYAGRRLRRSRLDLSVVLNCCHGAPGEDGTLQAAFDMAGLHYSGPSHAGAALGMDKFAFTSVIAAAGLPTLPLWVVNDDLELNEHTAPLAQGPLIVKPRFGGSSIGIEIVEDLQTAKALTATAPALAEGAVVQPYMTDSVDLNISLLAWPTLRLSSIERPLRGGANAGSGSAGSGGNDDGNGGESEAASGASASGTSNSGIYSYADKYLRGTQGMASSPRELPANLPPTIKAALEEFATKTAGLALARSVSRLDFLWDGSENPSGLYINELNTIPGSLSWYFWTEQGVSFGELLHTLIGEAEATPQRRFRTDGADGTALRSVNDISSKLA